MQQHNVAGGITGVDRCNTRQATLQRAQGRPLDGLADVWSSHSDPYGCMNQRAGLCRCALHLYLHPTERSNCTARPGRGALHPGRTDKAQTNGLDAACPLSRSRICRAPPALVAAVGPVPVPARRVRSVMLKKIRRVQSIRQVLFFIIITGVYNYRKAQNKEN
jgi:hypothetical protein